MESVEGMRGNGYAGASRHGRDPPPFGDAAANRGIRLKNGYAGALDQLSMRPSSRDDFSGRDRQRQSLRQAAVIGEVFRPEVLFDENGDRKSTRLTSSH